MNEVEDKKVEPRPAISNRLLALQVKKQWGVRELSWALEIPEPTIRTWLAGRSPRGRSPVWKKLAQLESE